MLSFKTHAIICVSLFAAIILTAVGGNVLVASGMLAQPDKPSLPAMIVFFGLFLAFGFSAVPVMVMTVMKGQTALGNTERSALIRQAAARQKLIVWAIWAVMALGTLIALPAAVMDGVFAR